MSLAVRARYRRYRSGRATHVTVVRAVEPLEQRVLLHGDDDLPGMFHALVNFQPAGVAVPQDYTTDTGAVYADRGNGYTYGWSANNSANTRVHNSILSPDARYDTLIHLQKQPTPMRWEIAVPDAAQYMVHVASGDPVFYDGNFQLNAEGKLVLSGKPTSANRWVEGDGIVTVTDGRLTISVASGAVNAKICYIDIQELPTQPMVTITATDASASEQVGTDTRAFANETSFGGTLLAREAAADDGEFRFDRTGDTSQPLTVNYLVDGAATPGQDYVPLSGTITIPAGSSSAPLVVTPIDDDQLEPGEDVRVTIVPRADDPDAYATVKLSRFASVWILDNETSSTLQPYYGTPTRFSATVQAEDFDNGPSGTAYKDNTTGNAGGEWYRFSNADVEPTTDVGGGFAITHLTKDEWYKYTIDAPVTGTYRIETRVASATSGGNVHVSFDGTGGTGQFKLPYTGGNQNWTTITKTGVMLTAGVHTMKFYVDSAAIAGAEVGSVNWIRVYHDLSGTANLSWTSKASVPVPREEAETASFDGKLYMMGGFVISNNKFLVPTRVDCYDVASNTWTRLADMPEPLTHSATVVDPTTGRIYIVGGYVGDNPGPATAHVWIYDTNTGAWSRGPDMPAPRGGGAAALLGRELHFVGGRNLDRTIDEPDHWALDLDDIDEGWETRAPIPNPRNHFPAVAINGKMYTIGGQIEETEELTDKADVQVYDPATDSWSRAASLPLGLSHMHTATVLTQSGKVITFGGESGHNQVEREVLMYDPDTNLWSLIGYLPSPRRAASAGVFGNTLVVAGGYYNGAQQGTTFTATFNL